VSRTSAIPSVRLTQSRLSTTRRKRPVPADWATADTIQSFEATDLPEAELPGSRALAVDKSGDLALFGGLDGVAIVYSTSKKAVMHTIKCGPGSITHALWWDSKPVVALSTGAVKLYENGSQIGEFNVHAGAATGLSLHPSGELLASVGSDKSYVIYDLASMSQVTRVFSDSGTLNPFFCPIMMWSESRSQLSKHCVIDIGNASLDIDFLKQRWLNVV
jgi:pre-mRNA-processing factor 19